MQNPSHNEQACQLPMIQWAAGNNRIAIGWGAVGDLAQYATPQDMRTAAEEIADQTNNNWLRKPLLGINLWNFRGGAHPFYARAQGGPHPHRQAMQCGDLVILKRTGTWKDSVAMRVTGPYEFIDPPQALPCITDYGYQHQRKAVPTCCAPKALWDVAGGVDGIQALGEAVVGNALVLLNFPVECEGA